jgi:serine/threonine protein kinase
VSNLVERAASFQFPEIPPLPKPSSEIPHVEDYEILCELGRGGMGVVYRARHVALRRIVALKMIQSGHGDSTNRTRYRAEAIARLQRSNIVQIYDVGEHDGRPFPALEFIRPESARRARIRFRILSPLAAWPWLCKSKEADRGASPLPPIFSTLPR